MAREDVVLHEEEDLGAAMQKLSIPFNELGSDLAYGFPYGLEDFLEPENPNSSKSMDGSNDSKLYQNISNSPSPTRGRIYAPKRSRNKGKRRKRQGLKSFTCLPDTYVDITDKSCSHCRTRKTPLWREGPRGPRTLCNACGVRYKTGRLLPEYRPASSPDFKPNVHSNFHRRVMKIRRERNLPPNSFEYEDIQH